jgi:superfamily II DNA helicase RecQ
MMSGLDSLIDVGTGAGKTLCMVLPCMISPETMAIVVSPLKRLQAVQVLAFSRYHIKAIAINEDTPNDPDLWKVCRL